MIQFLKIIQFLKGYYIGFEYPIPAPINRDLKYNPAWSIYFLNTITPGFWCVAFNIKEKQKKLPKQIPSKLKHLIGVNKNNSYLKEK